MSLNNFGRMCWITSWGIALRAGPIVEAVVVLAPADRKFLHRTQCGAP